MIKPRYHKFLVSLSASLLFLFLLGGAALASGTSFDAAALLPDSLKQAMSKGWTWAYVFTFIGGVGSCLTPCVYPLIAITVSIFVGGTDASQSRLKSFALTGMYTLGLAVTMSVLGIIAGLAGGRGMGAHLSSPWVVLPLVILFLALAASMFGAFELSLPSAWNAKLNQVGGAGPIGAFLMGLVGGLIALPCTGPVLAGILAFVGARGNAMIGATLLITYAVGFGMTFWIIATFSMWLPKSGSWMEGVKTFFGVVMVVVAVYFLEALYPSLRHLASPKWWFLAASLTLVGIGAAFGAFHLTYHGTSTGVRIRKTLGVLLVSLGAVGTLHSIMAPRVVVKHRTDLAGTLVDAKKEHKPVIMDFWASYCTPCLEMDRMTFGNATVAKAIEKRFELVKIDCTKDTAKIRALRKKYKALELPTLIILDSHQKQVFHHSGFIGPKKFRSILGSIK